MISSLSLPLSVIKKYLNVISRHQEKVNIPTIFYYIKENNPGLYIQISNPGTIHRFYIEAKERGITSYYGSHTEVLLRFARMIADYDFEKSYLMVRECINEGILRPCFRNEDIVDSVLCESLKIAKENFWYSDIELRPLVSKIKNMIVLMQDSTDGVGRSSYFNYVLKEYIPALYKEFSISGGRTSFSCKEIEITSTNEEVKQTLNIENLKKYYVGDIKGVDYSSKELWELLISYEKKKTGKLDILFDCFKECHYPYIQGFGNCEFHYIPTAILWNDPEWSYKIKEFIMEQGGRAGIYNIIKACSIVGE